MESGALDEPEGRGETPAARMDRRTSRALLTRLRADADRICARYGLRYRVIEAERANVKRRYGICYSDGTIKIRLRNVQTGRPLKYSSLVNTLCHELAHLRHFDHSPRFYDFYHELLGWSRRQGIYRPGRPKPAPRGPAPTPGPWAPSRPAIAPPPRPPAPEQLSLF